MPHTHPRAFPADASRSSRAREHPPARCAASAILLLGLLALGASCSQRSRAGDAAGSGYEGARIREVARGAELFVDHCALCDGHGGAGNGPAAPLLFPPARDFGRGLFRLVSTENAVPSAADLAGVLRRGLPGSAMPAFGWMAEEDLAALVAHVRFLASRGLAERLATRLAPDREPLSPASALDLARTRMTAGATLEVPPPAEPSDEALARGRALYLASCAACHGEAGQGWPDDPHWNPEGDLSWARDFTAGVLKGGSSHEALARRILLGMPGTAMAPTVPGTPEELSELVLFVQSLIQPGSEDRLVHRAGELRAARTELLPRDGADPRWEAQEELRVVLSPLAWHDDSIRSAHVAAVHDGHELAVRVRWSDRTRDDRIGGPARHGDGISLAWTSAPTPPMVGMGSPGHPVNLWHWKAFHAVDAGGLLDILEGPHRRSDPMGGGPAVLDAPLYLPTPRIGGDAAHGEVGEVEALRAEGLEHVQPAPLASSTVAASASWFQGEWTVVFTRSLSARVERELELPLGASLYVSLGAWNGTADERHGKKSFSIWQRLELQR